MKFILKVEEFRLLKELEAGVLDCCLVTYLPPTLDLTGMQVRDFVMDLFDWLPLLNDKDEIWTLANLGIRLTNKCL